MYLLLVSSEPVSGDHFARSLAPANVAGYPAQPAVAARRVRLRAAGYIFSIPTLGGWLCYAVLGLLASLTTKDAFLARGNQNASLF
jgi:hypothetical protein